MARYQGRRPPIVEAIEGGGDIAEIRRLLDAGTDPNELIEVEYDDGHFNTTPLVSAAHAGRPEVVGMLLERGAKPDGGSLEHTPLTVLVRAGFGNPEVVRLLVEAGADPNQRERETEQNILAVMAELGDLETVRFLLERGSEIEIDHLRAAARSGSSDVFGAILCCPAVVKVRHAQEGGRGQLVPRARADAATRFEDLIPATTLPPLRRELLVALLEGRQRIEAEDVVAQVRSLAPNVGLYPETELAPLHVLCSSSDGDAGRDDARDLELVRVLIDAGQPIDQRFPLNGPDLGATPLLRAAGAGRKAIVELLLARGADPRARDEQGRTACAWADRAEDEALVQRLVGAGAERQAWTTPTPEPCSRPRKKSMDLMTKIGLWALLLAAAIALLFWLLIRLG